MIAANLDTVFLVTGLDRDYSLRRIERYVVTAREGGTLPVVVLNKADVCDDLHLVLDEAAAVRRRRPRPRHQFAHRRGPRQCCTCIPH